MLSLNSKHVQHVKIYLACNYKVNLITHLEVIALFSSNFKSVHVSNLFWSRENNSSKEICKYASYSKVGGNYPLDLKIIWSSECWYRLVSSAPCKYFVFCSSTSAVFTAVLTMSSMIPLTILSLDTNETVRNLVARLFMFLLIFNEQRVPKFTFVLVLN